MSFACAESHACYISVHGSLENNNTQDRIISLVDQVMWKLRLTTRSVSDGEVHLFCHVHMSLPCTGGSPLQNFSGGKRIPEHEKKFFDLLSACEKVLNKLEKHEVSISCELPNSNRYWTHPKLQAFVQAELHSGLLSMLVQWELKGFQDCPSRKRSGSCQVQRSFVNVLRSVFIVPVIFMHHSTFLTFSCQKNTPGSLPGFLCECSHYLPSGDRRRRSYCQIFSPDLPP